MKLPSIRKGCMHCGKPLTTMGEKLLRTCKECAAGAREGFAEMGEGKFTKGYGTVKNVLYGKNIEQGEKMDVLVHAALSKKEEKIRKKLKKKGLSESEIEEGLKQFKGNIK